MLWTELLNEFPILDSVYATLLADYIWTSVVVCGCGHGFCCCHFHFNENC